MKFDYGRMNNTSFAATSIFYLTINCLIS